MILSSEETAFAEEIQKLKEEKDAVILSHFYASAKIRGVSDYVGGSRELAEFAKESNKKTVVVCGSLSMAETVKSAVPEKTVLIPSFDAVCPMTEMLTGEELSKMKAENPDAAVVCSVNASAEVVSMSDFVCGIENAESIIAKIPQKKIIFVPDKNFGGYLAPKFPDKEFILSGGYCPVHNDVNKIDVIKAKLVTPNAKVVCHPQCGKGVCDLADFVGSASAIADYCRRTDAATFIVGTENGVVETLAEEMPDKVFYPVKNGFACDCMKTITLENTAEALRLGKFEITLKK